MDHIRQWVNRTPDAVLLPEEAVAGLTEILNSLPWRGTRLDWSVLEGVSVDVAGDFLNVDGSSLSQHEYAVAYLGPRHRAVAATREELLLSLDEIFWKSPGTRYVFGADLGADGQLKESPAAIGEYDGGDELIVTRALDGTCN